MLSGSAHLCTLEVRAADRTPGGARVRSSRSLSKRGIRSCEQCASCVLNLVMKIRSTRSPGPGSSLRDALPLGAAGKRPSPYTKRNEPAFTPRARLRPMVVASHRIATKERPAPVVSAAGGWLGPRRVAVMGSSCSHVE